jgi:beta-galactosidase GanA
MDLRKQIFCLISLLIVLTVSAQKINNPILGGELSNSAATSVADIDEVMPRMKALGLNTVLIPAYWELMEPVEGKFDFTLIDRTIDVARREQLHVVFLWFGVWKNSMSCYTPGWFKQDTKRFPRAMTAEGKQMEIASCFSDNVLQADLKAFSTLMRHIREKDPQREVVIMMQIENEIGMLESARDHSPLAEKAYKQERWAERYGTDEYADEKFMALSYARYVEHLAKAAREIHDMPLYVNAAMNSRGRRPGEYPSAGPLAHLIDFWHEGAPSIDLLAPDIYDTGFKSWCAQYAMPLRPQDGGKVKNRLFIPESRCCENSGVRALYAFGEHQALGFSPFAIDQASVKETESVTQSYNLLRQVYSLTSHHSPLTSYGILFDQNDQERIINDDNVVMTCRHYFTLPWDPRATDGSTWPEGGAILIRLGKFDYLLAGSGVVIDFKTPTEKQQEEKKQLGEDGFAEAGGSVDQKANKRFSGKRLGLLSVDEVEIDANGIMKYLRRHNGDQTHQGRHARIGVGEWKLLHIKLYEY